MKFFAADFALQNSIFGIYDLLQWFRKIGYIGLEIKNAQISESEDTYRTIGGGGGAQMEACMKWVKEGMSAECRNFIEWSDKLVS